MILIETEHLRLTRFAMTDAADVFACITPAITRYLPWEPPSWDEYRARCEMLTAAEDPHNVSFTVRRRDTGECLGMASIERADRETPETGLWLKETAHGRGYGGEIVRAVIGWGGAALGKTGFLYPVAEANTASRRIAERLGGGIAGRRMNAKYEAVVYLIVRPSPWATTSHSKVF